MSERTDKIKEIIRQSSVELRGIQEESAHLQEQAIQESELIENIQNKIIELNKKIVEGLREISILLKEDNLEEANNLKNELVELKKICQQLKIEGKEEIDFRMQLQKKLEQEAVEGFNIEDSFKGELLDIFSRLSPEKQNIYFDQIVNTSLKQANQVKKATALKGIFFELSRREKLKEQNLETIGDSPQKIELEYFAYPESVSSFQAAPEEISSLPEELKKKVKDLFDYNAENNTWSLKNPKTGENKLKAIFKEPEMSHFILSTYTRENPPTKKNKSTIDFDIPILRKSKDGEEIPYVYETKAFPRRIFGQIPSNYNQLLKYNEAVEKGLIDGATLELQGRIDSKFLKWAAGETIDDVGAIPNVEIIYNIKLPSGAEYRFTLKDSRKDNGLKFINEDRKYNDEDRKVIQGIQKAKLDKSILSLLSNLNEEDFSEDIKKYLNNPANIQDIELYNRVFSQVSG